MNHFYFKGFGNSENLPLLNTSDAPKILLAILFLKLVLGRVYFYKQIFDMSLQSKSCLLRATSFIESRIRQHCVYRAMVGTSINLKLGFSKFSPFELAHYGYINTFRHSIQGVLRFAQTSPQPS